MLYNTKTDEPPTKVTITVCVESVWLTCFLIIKVDLFVSNVHVVCGLLWQLLIVLHRFYVTLRFQMVIPNKRITR